MAVEYLKSLVKHEVPKEQIGVISPYSSQLKDILGELQEEYRELLEIKTVDGFQGKEMDVIVLSLVRSNRTGQVGFLSEARRINMALTGARKHLTIICDARTIFSDESVASLVQYCNTARRTENSACPVRSN